MLKEFINVKQIKSEEKRRWFSDVFFDLIVWFSPQEKIIGFQLCYDKENSERAITWRAEKGYTHTKIDDGESQGAAGYKMTPILQPDGIFNYQAISERFQMESLELEKEISSLVYQKILEYRLLGENT